MPSLRESIGSFVRDTACFIADSADRRDELWEQAKRDGGAAVWTGQDGFSPDITAPVARLICGDAPGTTPDPVFSSPAPFEGGQCEGVRYAVDLTITNNATGSSVTTIRNVGGPVIGLRTTQNGSTRTIELVGTQPNGEPEVVFVTSGGAEPYPSAVINSVSRIDGEPDNCGNPGDGTPPSAPGDINYDTPEGPQTDPVVVTPRPPYRTPDGDIGIPFNIDFPDGPLVAIYFPGSGDVQIGDDRPDPNNSLCCPQIDPDSPVPPDGPDDPPPPGDERRFAGVVVTAIEISNNLRVTELEGGGVKLYIPRLSTVSFAVEIDGRRAWTDDIPVRKAKQFVPVPAPAFGYDWAVYDEPGVTTTVTPVYIPASPDDPSQP